MDTLLNNPYSADSPTNIRQTHDVASDRSIGRLMGMHYAARGRRSGFEEFEVPADMKKWLWRKVRDESRARYVLKELADFGVFGHSLMAFLV
ncbi:hypothetical protein [Fodinicola acaciae]|uniref:hypothetical protein n=1 Tax=Fodinicola acaciae TaxID=2681555 RepID=UPI0013D4EA66|nr:hypothetical protein [Fodinicola acaciae]